MDPITLALGIVLFALLGTAAGVATGLTPGLHVNTVAALVLAFQTPLLLLAGALFAWASPSPEDLTLLAGALVVGNVIAHTFLDFIPAIFLGAPEAETALSMLPGHRMLLRGRGLEAVHLSAWGSLTAAVLAIGLILPFRLIMGAPLDGYRDLRPVIPYLLILVAAILIVGESGSLRGGREELVCRLPDGILREKEGVPEILELSPTEAPGVNEAFLLRGTVEGIFGRRLVVTDGNRSVDVRLDGEPPASLKGEVLLFVALSPRGSSFAGFAPKGWAILVFLLAGTLGSLVLLSPLTTANWYPLPAFQADPRTVGFLPLFTGLFALPTLLISLARTPHIPPQEMRPRGTNLPRGDQVRAILGGSLAGAFVAWIPGVTAAVATVFARLLSGREGRSRTNDEGFILSLSCVNTSTALFTIVALFVILRARSGGAAALQTLGGDLVVAWDPLVAFPPALAWFLLAAMVTAVAAFFLTRGFGGLFARLAAAFPYRKIVIGVLLFLTGLIFLLTGAMGLVVAAFATLLGLLPPLVGVRRVHLMGSLLVPLILLLT
ncbi:MAG: tripartite tricarboxylate transporter permease [Thermoplasmata archaeon]